MLKEFKAFLLRGNLVETAVGIVIGLKVKDIVDALVGGIITPLIGIVSNGDFASYTVEIRDSSFAYGLVINAIIAFVATAALVFFVIVKPMNAIAARRKAGAVEEDVPPTQEELLAQIRDLLAAKA